MSSNPFLSSFKTPFNVPPFQQIKTEHYMPALESAIEEARAEIKAITDNKEEPSFKNTVEALEFSGEKLGIISSVLFNLNSAETNEQLQKAAQEASPLLSAFDNEIKQNELLFSRINTVFEQKEQLPLNGEQKMLLDKTFKSFIRSGANLDGEKKARFKEISIELSKLSLSFGENVLHETNNFQLIIDNPEDLKGLPEDVKKRAAMEAEEHGLKNKWIFTLHAPSYLPFMEYADNRKLREKMFRAYMSKAIKGDEWDNRELIKKIVALREEMAGLLGYETFASYVLEERMAGSPGEVMKFLYDLLEKAFPKAQEEVQELDLFMKEMGVGHALERWDWAYFSEKLRKKKYNIDEEEVKQYFRLENVIDGVFLTAGKLYGLHFKKNEEIPVYHEDVTAYEVTNESGEVIAVFFADFFPRKGKRPGAWMTTYRNQYRFGKKKIIPHVSIVCNFTPSSPDNPSLLKFDEVKTLFHEFGHALHGMLADTTYQSLSGTNVYWDFVELPSQIFENWCFEKECLDSFAKHFETGEPISQALIDKLKASANYHEAYATVRQISFGLLDMNYHHLLSKKTEALEDVEAFEKEVMKPTELLPEVKGSSMSVQFGHIFAGGYAAGYYSYKWAEVLDADSFELFKEKGVFDTETAHSFRDNILAKGGTEHPMDLYVKFRGKKPDPNALLRRAGLL